MPMIRISSFIIPCCAAVLLALFLPEQALAWGPGAHMVTGNWILQNLHALPLSIAAALMQYPAAYLHGSLSPDIFIGKGSRPKKGHSHNWESGFSLLNKAASPQELSYACGYLAHLAADVVAHNVFVPGLLHTLPGSKKMAHVYLEAQADRLLSWDSGDAVGVLHGKNSRANDALLRSALRQRAVPFWIKKCLFESSVALGGTRVWRSSIRAVDFLTFRRNIAPLADRLMTLSTRAAVNILCEQRRSPLLAFDPIGAEALARAGCAPSRKTPIARSAGLLRRTFATSPRATGNQEETLNIPVPPVLETFPPLCTSDGMMSE